MIFSDYLIQGLHSWTNTDNDEVWRIKTNEELEKLIKKKNIVRFIKSQRLRWAAHIIRMDATRTIKKLTDWEPCSSRAVGRPRLRFEMA
jgi:hypothetical protein